MQIAMAHLSLRTENGRANAKGNYRQEAAQCLGWCWFGCSTVPHCRIFLDGLGTGPKMGGKKKKKKEKNKEMEFFDSINYDKNLMESNAHI